MKSFHSFDSTRNGKRERERERERARGEREIVFAGIGKTINRSPYNVYLKTSLKAKLQQLVWPLEAKL